MHYILPYLVPIVKYKVCSKSTETGLIYPVAPKLKNKHCMYITQKKTSIRLIEELTNNKRLHQLALAIIPGRAASCVDGASAAPKDGLSAP